MASNKNTSNIELEGVVVEALPNAMFRVKVSIGEGNEHIVLCTLSGKMKTRWIRVLPGDKVKIVVVPPDLTQGRIIYRFR